jgi:hypothetical protein
VIRLNVASTVSDEFTTLAIVSHDEKGGVTKLGEKEMPLNPTLAEAIFWAMPYSNELMFIGLL